MPSAAEHIEEEKQPEEEVKNERSGEVVGEAHYSNKMEFLFLLPLLCTLCRACPKHYLEAELQLIKLLVVAGYNEL